MNIKVNGVEIPSLGAGTLVTIELTVDAAGERMPKLAIIATGGRLDCYASDVTKSGDIVTHIWGDAA